MSAFDVATVVVDLPVVGGARRFIVRAPKANEGGGITVCGFDIVNGAAITTAGFTVNLVKLTGGTAVAGTVYSVGGTATSGDLGRPGANTIFGGTAALALKVNAGDALAIDVTAVNAGTITAPAQAILRYQMGLQ